MILDEQVTANFRLIEMFHSNTADANGITEQYQPTVEIMENARQLLKYVLQPLRDLHGKPIHINCGYRCKRVNDEVGGVKSSQHLTAQAADCSTENNQELIQTLLHSDIDFDQCISEKGTELKPAWVHISYNSHDNNRKQFIRIP